MITRASRSSSILILIATFLFAPSASPSTVLDLRDVAVWTFNEAVYTADRAQAAAYAGPQFCMRAWFKYSGIPYDYYADPRLDMGSVPQLLNARGALFEGGVQVSDLHRSAGWPFDSPTDEDHKPPYAIPEPVFEDFTTRNTDGDLYTIPTIYGFGDECHASIANENYRDFVVFWAEEQIDRNVNALEFDVISGGYGFTSEGTPGNNANDGYDDYAIGTANFATSLSVAYARGTSDQVRWFKPTAAASSAARPAAAAIDDDPATYWLSAANEPVHILEIDFGRARTVQQLLVSSPAGASLSTFRLEYWSDGVGWRGFTPAAEVAGTSRRGHSFLVDPVVATKVRFVSTESQAAVAEMRTFGTGFRQYLLAKYGRAQGWSMNDARWTSEKAIDLADPRQCPDGTMASFDYRGYLTAHGWTGNPFGRELSQENWLRTCLPSRG